MEREDLMAPKGLKIGDTFDEKDFTRTFRLKVVGFDGMGNYISECIGEVKDEPTIVDEELPFASTDDDVVEQPVVEEPKEVKEVKKAAPKKKTASKKTATKKK